VSKPALSRNGTRAAAIAEIGRIGDAGSIKIGPGASTVIFARFALCERPPLP
jgi:hypothetical protein